MIGCCASWVFRSIEMDAPLIVAAYDPQWANQFAQTRVQLLDALRAVNAQIEHIGSTSVVGLAAKPIIDIMLIVENETDALRSITPIIRLGYICLGENEVQGRVYFRDEKPSTRHLHLYAQNNPEIERHLNFRDYLRAHPDTAQQYAELKYALAEKFRNDRPGYTEAKTEFIRDIEARAQAERAAGRL